MDAVDIKTIPQGYKQSDLGLIPNDWETRSLYQVLKVKHGKSQKEVECANGKYPILATGGEIGRTDKYLYSRPSVLIGRKGTIDVPRFMDTPFWTVDTLFYTQIYDDYDEKFIYYKFNLIDWYNYNEASGVPSLNASTIEKIHLSFPNTKKEQELISGILSDIDSLIQKTEKLIAKKQAMKQAAMSQLLSGKQRLPGFNGEWKEINLTEGYWFQEGPGVRTSQFTKSGIKLLNGTNIFKGEVNLETTERFISKSEAYGPYSHFLADDGDIVIASSGISVEKFEEKVAFIRKKHLPLCMNTSTIRFKSLDYTNKKISFLYYFLMTEMFKKQISSQATGSAQLNFGPAHLKKITMNLPVDSREQEAIIDIIADLDKEISRQEKKLVKYNQIKQGAMQVLLTGKIRLNTNPYDNPITQSRAN